MLHFEVRNAHDNINDYIWVREGLFLLEKGLPCLTCAESVC